MATTSGSSTSGSSTSASSLQESAKETARAKLTEQQQAAAGGLGEFAGALRKSASELQGDNAFAGRLAETAADGLQRVADTLRSKDVGSLMRDTERFAREQPVVFFSAALAAGFLAMRFLKSSSPEGDSGSTITDAGSYGGTTTGGSSYTSPVASAPGATSSPASPPMPSSPPGPGSRTQI